MNTTLTRTSTATIADAAAASPRHNKAISATRVVARTRRRTPLLLIIAAAIAAALPLMGATPAQAATYRDPTPGAGTISTLAASGCRAAPYRFHFEGYGSIAFPEDPTGQWNATTTPVLKTTTECRDINVKNTTKGKIRVCVMFGKTSRTCNYQTTIVAGAWANAATNVKDNTYFRMRLGILVNTPGYAGGATGVADF
ncbi:hypothetical protein GCM10010172_30120 [Paractinoplanes ferrugineus]|uniref:Uncharacterized protein n=1 Tax=Paractinoplanes ferrugineus TaxID=113564 RepID=A0A919J7R9_9ACTN|nr:hypothetical protein [Actinoplanes ferrugineus]GIE15623.1 hypothetical protein Afe05nite_74630 [Actinoplanes ferrugineus]